MAVKDYFDAAKKFILVAETQKRQEEDIKELKQFMLKVSLELQKMSDRIDIGDAKSKAEVERLAERTKYELEILSLKMQLAAKDQPHKHQLNTGPKKDDEKEE